MFAVFTELANWLVYQLIGLDADSRLGQSVHFFVEDTSKILVLLVVMIYLIALARASMDLERVRDFLRRRNRFLGYVFGAGFGAVTPFCSCSSIPLFLGFTSAGIPIGITMAFLLTSPIINEVAVVLLWGLLGWKFTVAYVVVGLAVGILGGAFLDAIRAERWLQPFAAKAYANAREADTGTVAATAAALSEPEQEPAVRQRMRFAERHAFARDELSEIFKRVWLWVIIGVGIGAGLHGFVPAGWFADNLGDGQWWSVPAATLAGLPLYANATGVIPVIESLIVKGLPVGTTLAFCMSTVAASIPEFVMLKQVMLWKLLVTLFMVLLTSFMIVGWIFNAIAPWLLPDIGVGRISL